MNIRKATNTDMEKIMTIYGRARRYMAETGNATQWGKDYPKKELIEQDIAQGIFYVCEDGRGIQGVFAFIIGPDPTYAYIEDGEWQNEELYGTIHRIASAGNVKGVALECFDWCFIKCGNLRLDTHEDNKIMQHLATKGGFKRCGRIYVADGSPRIAYQRVR